MDDAPAIFVSGTTRDGRLFGIKEFAGGIIVNFAGQPWIHGFPPGEMTPLSTVLRPF